MRCLCLIPGFEYDFFISYRHKDNKYDGWVIEFAESLRKVLPFKNLSSNREDQCLADGMMNAILRHLQKIKDLRCDHGLQLSNRVNLFLLQGRSAMNLNVTYVLEGRFQKVGNKAKLTRNDEL